MFVPAPPTSLKNANPTSPSLSSRANSYLAMAYLHSVNCHMRIVLSMTGEICAKECTQFSFSIVGDEAD